LAGRQCNVKKDRPLGRDGVNTVADVSAAVLYL